MSGPVSRRDACGCPCWHCCAYARQMKRDAELRGAEWREALDAWAEEVRRDTSRPIVTTERKTQAAEHARAVRKEVTHAR